MKKLLKALVAIGLVALLFSCDLTLLIPEAEITYNTVSITNGTDKSFNYVYIVPADEYYGIDVDDYDQNYYDSNYYSVENYFTTGNTITLDLSLYSDTDFVVVLFEREYNTLGYYYFGYATEINKSTESFTVSYDDYVTGYYK